MDRQDELTNLSFAQDSSGVDIHTQIDSYIKCNTFNLEPSSKLYHIIKYEYLIKSLEHGCLYMRKPNNWDDIYETFLLNYKAEDTDGSLVGFDLIKDKLYFQCWSTTEESYALWKVRSFKKDDSAETKSNGDIVEKYIDDNKLVKIKSSGDKLMKYLYDIDNPSHRNSYFIGSVNYVDEKNN